MAHFIEMKTPVGEHTYFVNIDLVRSLQPLKNGGTSIKFDDQHSLNVSMDAKQITDQANARR
jgi:hypothetical protein